MIDQSSDDWELYRCGDGCKLPYGLVQIWLELPRLNRCGNGCELSWLDRSGAQWLRTTAAGSVRQWLRLVWWLLQAVLLQRRLRTTAAGTVRCIMRAVPPHRCGNGGELPPLDWCGETDRPWATGPVRWWLQSSAAGSVRRGLQTSAELIGMYKFNQKWSLNQKIVVYKGIAND